jgi:MSHA biogenesis protein MshM
MYRSHFGLREVPFGLTPDTSFAFACTPHQQALNTLLVAVANGEGFIKITGEVGMGKTLLCRRFLSQLEGDFVTAYIADPQLDSLGLLRALAEELRLTFTREDDRSALVKTLHHALLDHARGGRRVVVCIDEAQAIPLETLESLRLLSNLETEKRKLIQVVMFGQPELDAKLAQPSVRQLEQRITFNYRLGPLTRREVEYYVAHRLRMAGYVGEPLFNTGALNVLFRASGGVPRLINVIAHKAMLAAFGEGRHQVSAKHVSRAASDTPASRVTRRLGLLTFGASAAAVLVVLLWYFVQ